MDKRISPILRVVTLEEGMGGMGDVDMVCQSMYSATLYNGSMFNDRKVGTSDQRRIDNSHQRR